jgi:hypothetical protein
MPFSAINSTSQTAGEHHRLQRGVLFVRHQFQLPRRSLANGVMIDLNTVIAPGSSLYLLTAYDNNDRGQIIGQAIDESS